MLLGIATYYALMYNSQNFAILALTFCFINTIHILKNIYFIMKYKNSNFKIQMVLLIELHQSLCYFIYFLGFYLLLSHVIESIYFLLFSLPYIIFSVVVFFSADGNNFYLN